ncbi:MAG: secretin N-terminal domain-containing protein [Gemmatimonadota bacterium]
MSARSLLPVVFATWVGIAPAGKVDEVRIAPAGGNTEITVLLQGDVSVSDFLLDDPPRLVLDIDGAASGLPREAYDGIGRGGVIRMRSTLFRDGVVRLVFDLTRRQTYEIERGRSEVRISFPNPGEAFERWSTTPGDSESVAEGPGLSTRADPGVREGVAAPGRLPEVDPRGRPRMELEGPRAVGLPVQQSSQPRISVTYDSASMLDVLAGFSEFAGVSIVPNGEAVDGVVRGVDIRDQPWDVALSAILSAQGLGWQTTESGIIIVDKLENLRARDTLITETRVLRINYASADSVAKTLERLATKDRGQVVAYQGTNSIIITDAPSVVARMDSLVRALDKRTPQVSIEAKIVFVDRSNVNELGIVYDLKERDGGFIEQGLNQEIDVPDSNQPPQLVDTDGDGIPDQSFFQRTNENLVNIGGSAVAALANANDRLSAPAISILTAVAFGDFSLFTFIDALEQHSLSDVQAAPAIQVVDNHKARIQVGERTPIRILERGAQVEEARINVQFEDTGIILEVTPHITNNNQVLLDLSAERSSLEVGLADVGFIFNKQIGQTRLLLDDGETAVIGGLTLSEVTRSESGIPGLMNIPLFGRLFRTTKQNEVKQDLIILVTPHIVGAGAEAAGG